MTTPPPKRSPSPGFSADLDDDHADKRLKIDESIEEAHTTPPDGPSASPQPQDSALSEPDEYNPPPLSVSPPTPDEELPACDGRSPSPSGDNRIPLWQNETRAFSGEIIVSLTSKSRNKKAAARKVARQAQSAPLMVDGKPQFNLFVDGSHQSSGIAHQISGPRPQARFTRGGYGVVFRNPYHEQGQAQGQGGAVEFGHGYNSNDIAFASLPSAQEDNLNAKEDFNIRSWRLYRVYSSRHSEMAALSQALETVAAIIKRQKPSSGVSVTIFTDSKDSFNRLRRSTRPLSDEDMTKSDALSMPLLRTIIWQLHYLTKELGCEITLRWLLRCCVLAYRLADYAAGWWKNGDEHESGGDEGAGGSGVIFQQKDRPLWRRDSILDALHEDVASIATRINAGEIRDPPRANGDMLDRFAGSAVQERMMSTE